MDILIMTILLFFGSLDRSATQEPFGQAQKNYGKYCGILQESLEKARLYNCRGVVWALDESRLYLTGFSFQPSVYSPENITFWIGPAKEPSRFADEIVPSDNGYYLEPKELPLQTFLFQKNTYKTAKKPSAEQLSSLLNLISPASAKKRLNSTNIFNSTIDRDQNRTIAAEGAAAEFSPKINTKAKVQKSEPHPLAEPVPSGQSNKNRIKQDQKNGANNSVQDHPPIFPAFKFTKDIELSISYNNESGPDQFDQPIKGSINGSINQITNQSMNQSIDQSINRLQSEYLDHKLNQLINRLDLQSNRYLNHTLVNSSIFWNQSIDLDFNDSYGIDLIVGGGSTVRVTGQYARRRKTTTPVSILKQRDNRTIDFEDDQENRTATTTLAQNRTTTIKQKEKSSGVTVAPSLEQGKGVKMKPLSWYAGAQPLILDLPIDRQLSEFRWISVWDHTQHLPIATLLLPSGPGFSIPKPNALTGFKPLLSKEVRSGPIEIIDTKTIRVRDFVFEGDAPGAWFYVGRSLIPVASGEIVPIYKEDGTYDCDYLNAYDNKTLTLKLPGELEVTDIFWLSVFCLPYGISFAHIYLPYKDLNVPASMEFESIPRCTLEQ